MGKNPFLKAPDITIWMTESQWKRKRNYHSQQRTRAQDSTLSILHFISLIQSPPQKAIMIPILQIRLWHTDLSELVNSRELVAELELKPQSLVL